MGFDTFSGLGTFKGRYLYPLGTRYLGTYFYNFSLDEKDEDRCVCIIKTSNRLS